MTKSLKFVIVSLISILFISCTFKVNSKRQNSEEDKNDAEFVTSLFYTHLENKEYLKTHAFFSPKFFEVTSASELDSIFIKCDEKLGEIKNKNLANWETNIVIGTNSSSHYLLVYNVTREKYNSVETIRLTKESDKIKILSYYVQSDGYVK
jgi:hypothetical protein